QQRTRDLGVQDQSAVAQPAQQIFPDVSDRFQLGKAQEAAGSLHGVNGAKDARQPLPVGGILLQYDQIAVQLVQILVTLDEEFLDDIRVVHLNPLPDLVSLLPRQRALSPALVGRGLGSRWDRSRAR